MKINYITHTNTTNLPIEIHESDAYHQAGQAIAISLGNQQKHLPAVHFQICLNPHKRETTECLPCLGQNYTLTLEGGRLIQSLPLCFAEANNPQFNFAKADNRCALEADMINLLAGPLAEAKYHAAQQGKFINKNSSVFSALRFYRKNPFIGPVNDYLESYFDSKVDRQHKLIELLQASFNFINDSAIWDQIKALADYFLTQPKPIIDCEEINFFLALWQKSACISLDESSLRACN